MSSALRSALQFMLLAHYSDQANHAPEVSKESRDPNVVKETKIVKSAAATKAILAREAQERADANPAAKPAPAWAIRPASAIGSLDGKAFLLAMRDAGRRPFETPAGKTVVKVEASKVRGDQIAALQGYCGYDSKADFGGQVYRATAKAQQEVRGPIQGPTREDTRNANRSLKGFVAGMPDTKATKLANLHAQEVKHAAELARCTFIAEHTTDEQTRTLHEGLALIEAERIAAIRKDIAEVL
jgi:hypothetical protein